MPALRRRLPRCVAALAALALCALTGCTRTDYRLQADRDVGQMIGEKSNDPRWGLPYFTLRTDPRSRYHDPTNPDRPPMPPDDPAAHRYMHSVDGMRGWPHWHRNGDLRTIELSRWRERLGEYVPLDEQGRVQLNVESAMQLGYMHSRDYRQQLETLYLSAIDVSTERFRLSTQFFANTGPNFTTLGRARAGGDASTLRVDSGSSLRRKFATGGELLVGFANSFVWQFAGDDTNNTNSLINFTLVQPLLRSGGRVVALEQLTIVERSLLANLRAFQFYRQGFYTFVTVGDRGVGSLQRRGGFFGGTGLTGFTGTGAGGIGGVGGGTFGIGGGAGGAGGGGAGGGTGFAGGGAGNVGGFLGLLQQLQQIRNVEENLAEQLRVLGLLEANLDAGLIDIGQVDQFRQNIETQRANLLQARNALQSTIDNFNVSTLGLPPDLELALDDTLIRQFQFIAPATHDANNALADLIAQVGELPDAPPADALVALRTELQSLADRAATLFATVEGDLAQMEEAVAIRERNLSSEERRLFAADRRRLRESLDELQQRNAARDAALAEFELLDPAAAPGLFADELVGFAADLGRWVQELSLVQARARLERLYVEPVELEWPQALAIARANRLDWMNNRAALVDTWRLIAFNANALESSLDVTFSGDLGTVGDNPVRFRSTNGSLRAGLRFDAPFTRLLERNNYRQVLIDYQRDRRSLMAFEDGVNQSLRLSLRSLEQLRVNLEIQRRAVVIALRRVDQTREVLNEPPPPVQPGQPAAQLGPTAALDALTALNDLRATQNNLMSVWLNYYAERMALIRDLGLMEIDPQGLWIDRPYDFAAVPQDYECWTPPALPERWLQDAGLTPESLDAAAEEPAEEVLPALELPDPHGLEALPELPDEPPADLEALPPAPDETEEAPLLPGPPLPGEPPRPRRGDDLPDPFEGRRPARSIERTSWQRPLPFLPRK